MTDQIPEPQMSGPRPGPLQRLSPVWLVPLGAVVISLLLAWQNYASRGPVIEILFENASGVVAKQTTLRYRDVPVGVVEKVQFAAGLESVVVAVRLDADIAPFVDEGSQFWVVRPQVTARGVSGLDTVISGVYIEGVWDTEPGRAGSRFTGLEQAPTARSDQEGLTVTLRSRGGEGLSEDTPVLYRGIEVGRVGRPELAQDGQSVIAEAFIRAPYAQHVSSATRFWNTSGFRLTFGPRGAQLDVSSLASLVSGGVSFDTVINESQAVAPGEVFELFGSEEDARSSLFSGTGTEPVRLSMVFEGDTGGLDADASIELGGVVVGAVAAVGGLVDEDRFGDRRVRMLATAELDPGKLGFAGPDAEAETYNFLAGSVERGMRARLTPASILTGGLKVVIEQVEQAAPAALGGSETPFPEFPTLPFDGQGDGNSVEGLIDRVAALPFEELLDQTIGVLDNANRILADDNLRRVPREAADLLASAREVVASDQLQALPGQVGNLLGSLESAAGQAEGLIAQLAEADAAGRLAQALDAAARAADGIAATADDLPDLVADLRGLAARVQELPLDDVVASADGLLVDARAVLSDPAIQGIPAQVGSALTDLGAAVADARALVAGIAEGGAADDLTATLAGARRIADDLAAASGQVPQLVGRLDAVAADVQSIALAEIAANADGLLTDARSVLGDPAIKAIPAQVGTALADVGAAAADARAALATVTDTGAVEDLAATLASARAVADDLAAASDRVPALLGRIDAAAANVQDLPLERIGTELAAVLENLRGITASDAAQALPAQAADALATLDAALQRARDLLSAVDAEQLSADLSLTLTDARRAAASVADATDALPGLTARLDNIAARVEQVPLDQLAAEAEALLADVRRVVGTDDARALPGALNGALAQVEAMLGDLREGGVAENTNATLAATREAAESIAAAAESLPALAGRLQVLSDQARTTLSSLDAESRLYAEIRAMLGAVETAARAVNSLTRSIERNPNSLLLGR
ncbi:MCE family protein [Rhodobacteraceae bacterium 2CG4]|uniref:MCE family protein n=1 Tax=Halovulum marinum TaxID=2662447 RepID=A0A6L5YVK3_9RHOB|nr:MlaD family protein [Halovulum marinum]MSU88416.1 MCE family protein [Halovulum marinum]